MSQKNNHISSNFLKMNSKNTTTDFRNCQLYDGNIYDKLVSYLNDLIREGNMLLVKEDREIQKIYFDNLFKTFSSLCLEISKQQPEIPINLVFLFLVELPTILSLGYSDLRQKVFHDSATKLTKRQRFFKHLRKFCFVTVLWKKPSSWTKWNHFLFNYISQTHEKVCEKKWTEMDHQIQNFFSKIEKRLQPYLKRCSERLELDILIRDELLPKLKFFRKNVWRYNTKGLSLECLLRSAHVKMYCMSRSGDESNATPPR